MVTAAAAKEEEETEDLTAKEGSPVSAHATANTMAVYKRLLAILLLLLLLILELERMGIEMKKTKTRRPSWRRAMSVQRRCAKQLIPLPGSKPATRGNWSDPTVLLPGVADPTPDRTKRRPVLVLLRRRWGRLIWAACERDIFGMALWLRFFPVWWERGWVGLGWAGLHFIDREEERWSRQRHGTHGGLSFRSAHVVGAFSTAWLMENWWWRSQVTRLLFVFV
jgi:hypothetical protein